LPPLKNHLFSSPDDLMILPGNIYDQVHPEQLDPCWALLKERIGSQGSVHKHEVGDCIFDREGSRLRLVRLSSERVCLPVMARGRRSRASRGRLMASSVQPGHNVPDGKYSLEDSRPECLGHRPWVCLALVPDPGDSPVRFTRPSVQIMERIGLQDVLDGAPDVSLRQDRRITWLSGGFTPGIEFRRHLRLRLMGTLEGIHSFPVFGFALRYVVLLVVAFHAQAL
jgi:hypothetical protein